MSFPLTCHIHPTLVGFLFLAATFPLSAQQLAPEPTPAPPQAEPSHRPRIGLAISGGGALGLTEIGVLKWFDEHHIPVDRIAGTSMGGIITAMYASGMSAVEIENFAEQVDWDQTLLARAHLHSLSLSPQAGPPQLSNQCGARPKAWPQRPQRFQSRPRRRPAARSHRLSRVRRRQLRRFTHSFPVHRHEHAHR